MSARSTIGTNVIATITEGTGNKVLAGGTIIKAAGTDIPQHKVSTPTGLDNGNSTGCDSNPTGHTVSISIDIQPIDTGHTGTPTGTDSTSEGAGQTQVIIQVVLGDAGCARGAVEAGQATRGAWHTRACYLVRVLVVLGARLVVGEGQEGQKEEQVG